VTADNAIRVLIWSLSSINSFSSIVKCITKIVIHQSIVIHNIFARISFYVTGSEFSELNYFINNFRLKKHLAT